MASGEGNAENQSSTEHVRYQSAEDEEITSEIVQKEKTKICDVRTKTFGLLCLSCFCYGLNNSLYGPLWPRQATAMGLSPTVFSLVIGSFHLITLIFTLLIGMWVQKIATKFILFTGLFTIGSCAILFGALEWSEDKTAFTAMAFVIRICDGFGAASVRASAFAISASYFPSQLWSTFISLEISFGLGMVVGPIASGALYDYIGFKWPFIGYGSLSIIVSILVIILINEPDSIAVKVTKEFLSLFKHMGNILYFFTIFSASFYSGFLEPTLQPLMNQLTLNGLFSGIIFQIPDAIWSLTAFLWKWKIKKGVNNVMLIFISNLLFGASLLLLAPARFTTLQISTGTIVGALVLKGFGRSAKSICSFHGAYSDSVYKGFYNDVTTHSFVFEMYALGTSLGSFMGSSISGYLYQRIGIQNSIYVPFGIEMLMIPFILTYAFRRNYLKPIPFNTPQESRPILS